MNLSQVVDLLSNCYLFIHYPNMMGPTTKPNPVDGYETIIKINFEDPSITNIRPSLKTSPLPQRDRSSRVIVNFRANPSYLVTRISNLMKKSSTWKIYIAIIVHVIWVQ